MKCFPIIILCLGLLVGCGVSKTSAWVEIDKCNLEKERIGARYLNEVYARYHYRSYSSMTRFTPKIHGFTYDFYTYEDLTEEAAQIRVSELIDLLKEVVDSDENVRPFLVEWPFQSRETSITLALMDPRTGRFRKAPKIAIVGNKNGKKYKTYAHPETGRLLNEDSYQKYLELKGDVPLTSKLDENVLSKERKRTFNSEPIHEDALNQSIHHFLR